MRALLKEMFQRPATSQEIYVVKAHQAVPPPVTQQEWDDLEDDAQWLLVRLDASLRKQGLRIRRHVISVGKEEISASVHVRIGNFADAMSLLDGMHCDLGEDVAVTIEYL